MPQREASVGAGGKSRRTMSKGQPQYTAGDDLAHGKHTGVEVESVDRDSEGFERFDDILNKNDKDVRVERKATRRSTRRSTIAPLEDVHEENDDEQSMELDEQSSSPTAHLGASGKNAKENHAGGNTSRLSRQPDVDYNRLPSPSARPFTRRAFESSPLRNEIQDDGPSTTIHDHIGLEQMSSMDDGPNGSMQMSFTTNADNDNDNDDGEENDVDHEKENRSIFGAKTTVGGAEDSENFEDAMAEIEDRSDNSPPGIRSRFTNFTVSHAQSVPDPDPDPDSQGDAEPEPEQDSDQEEEPKRGSARPDRDADKENKPSGSKSKQPPKQAAKKPQPKKAVKPLRKRVSDTPLDDDDDESGLRRGKRLRFEPLEWWRCEHVKYGKPNSGRHVVPVIKEIIRLPKEEPLPLSKKHRPKSNRRRIKAEEKEVVVEVVNPELGWDDKTESNGIIRDVDADEFIEKRIAFTAAMVRPRPAMNNDFFYQKIFGDGEFIAAGQLIIPPKGKKPPKSTKDNTYVFYLIEGGVNLMVHESSFLLATGAMFIVPRGNTYCIENVSSRDAKLFFAQARKIPMAELLAEGQESRRTSSTGPSRAHSQPNSAG